MNHGRILIVLSAGLLMGLPTTSIAQRAGASSEPAGRDTLPPEIRRWEITPYAGALWVDDGELGGVGMEIDAPVALFGVRFAYRLDRAWRIGASYGYAGLTATADSAQVAGSAPLQSLDGRLHTYDVTIDWSAPSEARARVVLTTGVGAVHYAYDPFVRRNPVDERVRLVDESWAHELVLLVGAGLEVDAGDRAAVRLDVRDHLQFCRAEGTPINETEDFSHCPLDDAVLGNVELSGGIAIRF